MNENYNLILNDITISERVLTGKNSERFTEYKSLARLLMSSKKKFLFEDEILSKFGNDVTLESLFEQNAHRFLIGSMREKNGEKQSTWHDIEASEEIKRGDQFFSYFFACKLRQIDPFDIKNFLNFHLSHSFNNSKEDFFDFLNILFNLHRQSHFNATIEKVVSDWMVKEKDNNKKESLAGANNEFKGKTERSRNDNLTKLNQEQTALLAYCMRETKIILRDENLNNTDAGQAFSILTGYSAVTLRHNLNISQLMRISTKKNIAAVSEALKELQTFMQNNLGPEEK